ncbi:hypothetical protein [Clostridium sp. C8-1-8]|uniref:hypothetical protein n=1 Tax=Clostridium sp. C8-1-8 TaxID=2698831 RepID=UPI00136B3954|nr:hypothetical protein [Clostridium sp. C8-1-8]
MLPNGTKLYDEDDQLNPKKANSYIYKAFLNENIIIDEHMRKNVSITDLIRMMNFDMVDFEKGISLNSKKKLPKWKYEKKKLGTICNVKIGGTPSRNNNEYYINAKHNWLSISEMNGNVIFDTKEKINDLAIKNSNVKLIKAGTTLLIYT